MVSSRRGKFTRLLPLLENISFLAMGNSGFGPKDCNSVENEVMGAFLFEGDHHRTTYLSERKEKKKKTHDPETLAEPQTLHPDPEAEEKKKRKRGREDKEPTSDNKKKKKRKKEGASGKTPGPAFVVPSPEVVHNSEVMGSPAATSEEKKKKRRKSKLSTGTCDLPTSSAIGSTSTTGSTDEPEKPQKRKPTDVDSMDANANAEPSAMSKSKKRKKEAAVGGEDRSTAIPMEDRSSRKRKKSKKSIHPDPSDDPGLTEQSQKGF